MARTKAKVAAPLAIGPEPTATSMITLTVYKKFNKYVKIQGPNITFEVNAGVLLVRSSTGVARYAFAPGQWITVNLMPILG